MIVQKFINILDGLDGLERTFADHSNGTQIIVANLSLEWMDPELNSG
jgi:hypothetical protein